MPDKPYSFSKEEKNAIHEKIANIYYNNKELINCIKDELYFIDDGDLSKRNGIFLYYDYDNNQLFCEDSDRNDTLSRVPTIHKDAIDFFLRVENENLSPNIEKLNPKILFWEVYYLDVVVEFSLYKKEDDETGIIYTNIPEKIAGLKHIEGNWYTYWFVME